MQGNNKSQMSETTEKAASLNFIEQIIEEDLKNGKHKTVVTRFPPEPNGYLHIGHAKAILTNFEIAKKYGGKTNLRFDDTNPVAEDTEYVDGIKFDLNWLGCKWANELYASDYFGKLYEFATKLIKDGKAYVDDSTQEEIRTMRGVPTKPGVNSPFRDRPIEESLELFAKMKAGEYDEGSRVLRAKVDMTSPNMHMRDPIMYRILKAHHHRTGNDWCIYPMYDFAHGTSDSIEGITHSLCSLEFEHHRPLYEWFNKELEIYEPQQIEFSRLNLSYTVMSKRRLRKLVEDGIVSGWDDPRMPTLSGMRRKGYPAAAIRTFIEKVGTSKRQQMIDLSLLESCVKDELNKTAPRMMAVLNPLKVVITNYPEGKVDEMEVINNPEDESAGSRKIPFSREIYIEREDFMEDAPKKFFRLKPGGYIRLKGAYILKCEALVKDKETMELLELRCSYVENSRSGQDESGIKVKGVIHWVSVEQAVKVEAKMYDRLFSDPAPNGQKDEEGNKIDFMTFLNPDSLSVTEALAEPAVKDVKVGEQVQFMRKGYFCVDADSTPEKMIFNRTATLRDSWAKKNNKKGKKK